MRVLVGLLLAANLLFLAWSQGILGMSSLGDREPERMSREVHPEAVSIVIPPLTPSSVPAGEAVCLESGPYSAADVSAAEVSLSSAISPGMWVNLRQDRPGQWVVYLGPFADLDTLARKEDEVRRTRVPYEAVTDRGELDYGLSLGRFGQLSEANAALARLSQQAALRNAKVVNLRQPTSAYVLRVEAASNAVAQRLRGLPAPMVKPFVSCPKS